VLKDKKCRDCQICEGDLRGLKGESLVSQLNERLVAKTVLVSHLEETSRK